MYSNWLKSEDEKVPEGRGRRSATELDEVEDTTKNKTQMDSLSLSLHHYWSIYHLSQIH